jgi:tagatose 1,6-diphosphate aldolase GatY/KbaY
MRAIADSAAVPVSVQLDHASDPHLIAAALRAGVDAVLADGSTLPPEENAAFVRTIRELGGPGVTIEASWAASQATRTARTTSAQQG